jgi:methyltransferase OMS1
VSAGTGRNLPYYPWKQLSSLTLTDPSRYMLWHAAQKFRDQQAAKAGALPVRFFLTDAQELACSSSTGCEAESGAGEQPGSAGSEEAGQSPPPEVSAVFAARAHAFPERSFDSVVDTFGLCSHADPVAVLKVRAAWPSLVACTMPRSAASASPHACGFCGCLPPCTSRAWRQSWQRVSSSQMLSGRAAKH